MKKKRTCIYCNAKEVDGARFYAHGNICSLCSHKKVKEHLYKKKLKTLSLEEKDQNKILSILTCGEFTTKDIDKMLDLETEKIRFFLRECVKKEVLFFHKGNYKYSFTEFRKVQPVESKPIRLNWWIGSDPILK